MNQQWRRNVKKAEKAGVQVRAVGPEGLDTFHALYVESAERDNFLPRPKAYFDVMARSFASDGSDGSDGPVSARFYEAHVDGDVLASALMIRFGRTFSYLYGGSTERNRDARASNALQWQAMRDAAAAGCEAYDFRGFNTSLGATSPLTGLLLFKARGRGRRRRDGGGARAWSSAGSGTSPSRRPWLPGSRSTSAARPLAPRATPPTSERTAAETRLTAAQRRWMSKYGLM